ncbi:MAG TPA: EscU/YscU/HrcU family type III secretion system export apparatus switch protein [Gammaproteobacteria bacterium]|nr:EscU/YscU/HrcU family type III secretion system export apparatus switch protein [Gammaproteobacteria bacterium]
MKDARALPLAVALRWEGDGAPRVTAKGRGEVAERILALAREYEVPLREDRALVAVLSKVELDHQIPPALYKAVAEVIAFAYALQGKAVTRRSSPAQGAAADDRSKAAAAAD